MRSSDFFRVLSLAAVFAASASAQVTLSPLSSFGSGDGWLAPGETTYLGVGNLERGISYNPLNNHVYLVSRATGGPFVRILDGTTGADLGALNISGVTGGTFALNKVVVDPGTGTIFATNLRTGTSDPGFRMYRWTSEGAVPSMIFDFIPDGTNPRIGDNLDLIGTGANAQIVAGYGVSTAPNANGYIVIDPTASAAAPTLPAFNNITFAEGAGGTVDGEFRLGITFIDAANSSSGMVLGTQGTSLTASRLTSYSGAVDDRLSLSGNLLGNVGLTATTERAFDYINFAGMGLLATVDTLVGGNSLVRLYDATNPASLTLLASLSTTTGASNTNSNSAGDVRFGLTGVNGNNEPTVTLYAMNTNNGIQAFVVTIPEPSALVMLGAGLTAVGLRRRRRP